MTTHISLLVALSALISLVFTFLVKYEIKERLRYFLFLFASFVLLSIVAGWLMFPLPL
jgi:hypothetical protein